MIIMDVFDSPEFVAAHQIRGGSPFLSLILPQKADLLTALCLSALSVPTHPGFNEIEAQTDFNVKRLNNFIIEIVNIIICPLFLFFPLSNFYSFIWF